MPAHDAEAVSLSGESYLPALTMDLSSWIPRLWRNAGDGDGTSEGGPGGAIAEAFEGVLEAAEEAYHETAQGLGWEESPVETIETEPVVSEEALIEDYRQLEKLPTEERAALWERILERLRTEGVPCNGEGCASYEAFVESLSGLGTNLPTRLHSLRTAMVLLHNHDTLGHEPIERPIALAIMPSWDHNGAFGVGNGFPILDTLEASSRFHLIYVEADDDGDVMTALREIHALTGRRVHTLLVGGHGSPNTLALRDEHLAARPDGTFDDTVHVDTGDFLAGEFDGLGEFLEPEGQILLASCSNGANGEENPFNLGNSFSRAAPGRRVYCQREEGNILSLEVLEDGSLEVEWSNHAPYVAFSSDGSLPELPAGGGARNAARAQNISAG
ncbi:MAG: hypothetical protein IT572_06940 [Deltaproteobacteria bacterium]|nr:hypothetical protein [Deltaproteobacteria bacterium]